MRDAGQLGDLGLNHRRGEDAEPFAEEVDVALGDRLADLKGSTSAIRGLRHR